MAYHDAGGETRDMPDRWRSSPRPRRRSVAAGRVERDLPLVRLSKLLVLPLDDRLPADARQELLHFLLLAVVVNLVGDQIADAVERLHARRLHRLELQDLESLGRPQRLGDVARIHLL